MARATVHPHVCGEHIAGKTELSDADGSSPRVWGTFTNVIGMGRGVRFIPTCVGNMRRGVGETWGPAGSSPRVWGTSQAYKLANPAYRFIPTCVGNMWAEWMG